MNSPTPFMSARDAVFIAMFAVASFAIENTIGLVLTPIAAAIPLIGGTLSAVPDALIVFLGAYLVPRRGAILLFATILLSLSIVTPSFGPPGVYKLLIGLALGLIYEVVLIISRRPLAYIGATAAAFAASVPVTYISWKMFHLPGVERLQSALPILVAIYFIEGAVGAGLGYWLFKTRLARLAAVRRLRGE